MIKCVLYDYSCKNLKLGGKELLDQYLPDDNHWLWVDLESLDIQEERELLEKKFEINVLAISDAQRTRHPPKFEAFDQHIFLLLRGLTPESDSLDYQTIQIAFFVGKNFLITRHSEVSLSIERAWMAMENDKLKMSNGPAHVAYKISRNVVDRYTPILLALEDRLEILEDEMFANPNDQLLAELIGYNSKLKKLRRTLTYQKNLFYSLIKAETDIIDQEHIHEFNDIYEHFERLSSLASLYQELVSDLMNGYLSLTSHRLNQIMKVLTIVTVLFLPLGLLAGIYGMNFEFMPELSWRYSYFIILGIMGSLVAGILLTLKKINWL